MLHLRRDQRYGPDIGTLKIAKIFNKENEEYNLLKLR